MTQMKMHQKREDYIEHIAWGLYMLAVILFLVGPDWLTKNTFPRVVLIILFCSPWVYNFVYSIYFGIEGLRNHPVRSLFILIGNILLLVALYGGEKWIWLFLCGLILNVVAGMIMLMPKMKGLPSKLSRTYKSIAETYEDISKSNH